MDNKTVEAYNLSSGGYAEDWAKQPPPSDMYALLERFFRPGKKIDIGCGAGRDVAWLCNNGFDAIGVDASHGLLSQARKNFPGIRFEPATLPLLSEIKGELFQNVLCETVLMHLEKKEIPVATRSLLDLLMPGGTLYLSWRVTPEASMRDKNGRLYTSFEQDSVLQAIGTLAEILFDQEEVSASSGKIIHRVIARRVD